MHTNNTVPTKKIIFKNVQNTYICMKQQLTKKEAMNLKKIKNGYLGEFGKRKLKEETMIQL